MPAINCLGNKDCEMYFLETPALFFMFRLLLYFPGGGDVLFVCCIYTDFSDYEVNLQLSKVSQETLSRYILKWNVYVF